MTLEDEDEFLVLATDGLWDVMDSQDVVSLARTSLRKGQTAQVGCIQSAFCRAPALRPLR